MLYSSGLVRVTSGVIFAKFIYPTTQPALETMSSEHVTRIMLPRSSIPCDKTKLQKRKNKRKQLVSWNKLKL